MRAVLPQKRKYTYKDIFRFFGTLSMHYLLFYVYYIILFSINLAFFDSFIPAFEGAAWLILYPLVFGPGINAMLHMVYAEGGFLWFRATMWFHTFFILILAPIVTFIIAGGV